MWALVLASAVSAAAPLKVASVGLAGTGVSEADAQRLSQHFAQQLAKGGGVEVRTPQQTAAALGPQRLEKLRSCLAEGQPCLADLAGALGVDVFLSGTVTQAGGRLSAAVRLTDPFSGRTLFASAPEGTNLSELESALNDDASAARQVLGLSGPSAAPRASKPSTAPVSMASSAPQSPVDWKPFTLMGAGLVSFGVSVPFFLTAVQAQQTINEVENDPNLPGNEALVKKANQARKDGNAALTGGWTCVLVGAALMAGGITWMVIEDRTPVTAALVPLPGGAVVAVSGALP